MKLGQQSRFTAEQKQAILSLVERTRLRTGWTLRRILKRLGLAKARYYEWCKRAAEEAGLLDRLVGAASLHAILPEEKKAVIDFALAHPRDGYRRLTWMMVDADVAYLSETSVYRVLKDKDLLYRWKRSTRSGEKPPAPTAPHQRWHTDIMYLRVENTWYFLVSVLDAFSRYIVHWDLLSSMTAADVRLVLQEALERTGAQPQIVSDNGSQFTAKDFRQLVHEFQLEHIRIRTYHPESNGVLERFHRSTREELAEQELRNLTTAREIIARWVKHYNEERLHAGLHYLPPAEYLRGNPEQRLQERKSKLELARQRRERINRARSEQAAQVSASTMKEDQAA